MSFEIRNKQDGGHVVCGEVNGRRLILGFTQANADGKTFTAVRMIYPGHNQSDCVGEGFRNGFLALAELLKELGEKGTRKWVSVRQF